MILQILKSFEKDALKLPALQQNKLALLIKYIEKANAITDIASCKKLSGYKTAYRIRMGNGHSFAFGRAFGKRSARN